MRSSVMRWLAAGLLAVVPAVVRATPEEAVKQVYIVFKTHLDVGYTDLSSRVTEHYVRTFIPKAMEVSERFAADGSGDRFVWTVGSWLIQKYLETASPEEVARLEGHLRAGDITYGAIPYTMESESMTLPMYKAVLGLSKRLDAQYGHRTTGAKQSDVPGHTRAIIDPLVEAGVQFLHIGVNSMSPVPDVPAFFRWRAPSGRELLVCCQQYYGQTVIMPGGESVLSIQCTSDNQGPHTYEQAKAVYADLRKRYPNAQVISTTLDILGEELAKHREELPVVTSEIGDTWIYGYASEPARMARFRALMRKYAQWIAEGKLTEGSAEATRFALELGLIGEHTWGICTGYHILDGDKYDQAAFQAARELPNFQICERSWREIDDYIPSAIAFLPEALRAEAQAAVDEAVTVELRPQPTPTAPAATPWQQALPALPEATIGALYYQTLDCNDYERYRIRYFGADYRTAKPISTLYDFGKMELEKSHAISALLPAYAIGERVEETPEGRRITTELFFDPASPLDRSLLPQRTQVSVLLAPGGKRAEVAVTLLGKPAVRLPEAYWFAFNLEGLSALVGEKMGERIDLLDVVERGGRRQHAIDNYIDLSNARGTLRITSREAPVVNLGKEMGLSYDVAMPDLSGGVQFCLSNNLWGTNFTMWSEGSMTYHFTVEWIEK